MAELAEFAVGLSKSLVTTVQSAIDEDARLRQKLEADLMAFTLQLDLMKGLMDDASQLMENILVKYIKNLIYELEDWIECASHLDDKPIFWRRLLPSCMAPPLPLDEAVEETQALQSRVEFVNSCYTSYNLIGGGDDSAAAGAGGSSTSMLVQARGATKSKKGFGDLTRLITMASRKNSALEVISVWGADGDHGTTSIIMKTYDDPQVCRNFTYRSWAKLIHPFSPHDFVRTLMLHFYANAPCDKQDKADNTCRRVLAKMKAMKATQPDDLFQEFERLVTRERYIVVLEGLSNMSDWDAIRAFFPDMKNGSCIVVSTRQCEIATLCAGQFYQILELQQFSRRHSVCALFKGSEGDGDKNKNHIRTLFGRDPQIKELGEYVSETRVNSPPVMSVWGIPGVGKSALVRKLYDERKLHSNNYDKYFWVDVSRPFNLRDLYLSLLQGIHPEKDPIEECHSLLTKHRCFVVIDELRSTKEWDLMQAALKPKKAKSVIIVITTDKSIATYCTNNNEKLLFNVKALEAAAAFDLFQMEVHKTFQDGVEQEVQELISKCGGIPKVIAAIASSIEMMGKMHVLISLEQKFMHHLETNPEYDMLQDLFDWIRVYFRDCPDYLKPCIFYLSIFPQGNIIRRRRLVRRWIAEGYSRDSHNESAEENGENHFSELLELSIIQQLASQSSSTSLNVDTDVRMVFCQVNTFIREYIVSQRREENLVFELGDKCALTTQRTGRHLVILKEWYRDKIVFERMDFSRLRSLTVFGEWRGFLISESMKLLRVLDLEDASRGVKHEDLDKVVKWLRRLKFLSLRGHDEIKYLPSSLHRMGQLQTLDIRETSIVTLPETITKLCNLQYIRAGRRQHHRQLFGVEVPRGIGKLTALHMLGVVDIGASGTKTMMKELKELTQLRKLGVSGINRKNIKKFVESIHGAHLESLSLQLDKDNQGCLDGISMPRAWVNLQSLKLYGLQDKLPQWKDQLSKLRKLDLEMATLKQNDNTEFLAKLPELCILRLCVEQLQDNKISFSAKMYGEEVPTYEKVKILEISCSSSSSLHVTFGSETMKNLELLKLDYSSGLSSYDLTGLNYLSELKEVLLKGTNEEALKTDLEQKLLNHPNKPVVNHR
ncbi:probable disease resistance protein RXW24L [Brachypodium distachyon]|uniref:NB-ARC domain-containing protein n=1 Tax=Brachypodium distachyon TaxID=15368 RepID=A0A0Q3H1U3_BRADI|nr:probable disease resistance protein RXW24L [Brachypodium distachyon]KQK16581.2 hypothetical protein BRADI_1g29381v3 [Brachypodium distachyon]|eukprot:XP_010229694.1 probable disease resistance protein RXW24L [Brachypodium distachyon]